MPIHPSIALALILLLAALLVAYVGACAYLYFYLFVPRRSAWLDDFLFTPWEFQADYEEVDLVTADGIAFIEQGGPKGGTNVLGLALKSPFRVRLEGKIRPCNHLIPMQSPGLNPAHLEVFQRAYRLSLEVHRVSLELPKIEQTSAR